MSAEILISDYDDMWSQWFDRIRRDVEAALSGIDHHVEHVGSTAVPGLAAKPIIDLDVVIPARSDFTAVRRALEQIGYQYEGDLGIAGREAFRPPIGSPAHHLYVCIETSAELARHLAFRGRLRRRPDVARAYADLKRDAARSLAHDRAAYTAAKSRFIEEQLQYENRRGDGNAACGEVANFAALRSAKVASHPFRWAAPQGVLDEKIGQRLAEAFPTDGFELSRRTHGTDKTYLMKARTVRTRSGAIVASDLAPEWLALLDDLTSTAYRAAISNVLQADVMADLIEIGLYRYSQGGFVSPHTDKLQKSVGHILFFNRNWQPDWGGRFRILGSSDATAICADIAPLLGNSVLLLRSANSWHSVEDVYGPEDRLALHVDFWRQDPGEAAGRESLPLRSV